MIDIQLHRHRVTPEWANENEGTALQRWRSPGEELSTILPPIARTRVFSIRRAEGQFEGTGFSPYIKASLKGTGFSPYIKFRKNHPGFSP
jgi:hypothetical protein